MERKLFPLVALSSIFFTVSVMPAVAALTFTVSDNRPGETAVTQPTSSLGTVTSTAAVPTTTFTVSNLDLTSVGGGLSETIAFDISYSATGGSAVAQVNGFGNISVTGGDNNQIDLGETLTATVSLNGGITTFAGTINLGLISVSAGGAAADELWDVVHDGGTIAGETTAGGINTAFASSSFVTLITQDGASGGDTINLQAFSVEITATAVPVPEPSSTALLGLGGLALILRRRR